MNSRRRWPRWLSVPVSAAVAGVLSYWMIDVHHVAWWSCFVTGPVVGFLVPLIDDAVGARRAA